MCVHIYNIFIYIYSSNCIYYVIYISALKYCMHASCMSIRK